MFSEGFPINLLAENICSPWEPSRIKSWSREYYVCGVVELVWAWRRDRERTVFRKWRSFRRGTVYERQCYDAEHRLCTECARVHCTQRTSPMPEGRCNATRYRKSISSSDSITITYAQPPLLDQFKCCFPYTPLSYFVFISLS